MYQAFWRNDRRLQWRPTAAFGVHVTFCLEFVWAIASAKWTMRPWHLLRLLYGLEALQNGLQSLRNKYEFASIFLIFILWPVNIEKFWLSWVRRTCWVPIQCYKKMYIFQLTNWLKFWLFLAKKFGHKRFWTSCITLLVPYRPGTVALCWEVGSRLFIYFLVWVSWPAMLPDPKTRKPPGFCKKQPRFVGKFSRHVV